MRIFKMNSSNAKALTQKIHNTGQGIAGVFPWDIAHTKADQVHREARAKDFPLSCVLEPV